MGSHLTQVHLTNIVKMVCEGTCLLVNNLGSILKTRPSATKYSSLKLGHTAYVLNVASFE